jgi:hypothetical protein
MKSVLLIAFVFVCGLSHAQLLSGSLIDEGRKLTSKSSFVMEDTHEGTIVFELAVDGEGKVTSAKLLDKESNVVSTPARIKASNFVKNYTFTAGTHYPQFQHVKVKLSLVSPKPIQMNQQ